MSAPLSCCVPTIRLSGFIRTLLNPLEPQRVQNARHQVHRRFPPGEIVPHLALSCGKVERFPGDFNMGDVMLTESLRPLDQVGFVRADLNRRAISSRIEDLVHILPFRILKDRDLITRTIDYLADGGP
jgi:hypothetical protein